jgi:hypothetical protein
VSAIGLGVGYSMTIEKTEIASRFYASIQHIQSAALFARQSHKTEKEFTGKTSDELIAEHMSYVIGAIFAAVSYLEATINEFFEDAVTGPDEHLKGLEPDKRYLLSEMWKLEVPKTAIYPILRKYEIALALAKKEGFSKGNSPYQDADFLVGLRNRLVHYEPKTTVFSSEISPESVSKELEDRFRGRFPFNPLMPKGPFFPHRCLSHGCAEWAVRSSVGLVDQFYSRMGVSFPFNHIRSRLGTQIK